MKLLDLLNVGSPLVTQPAAAAAPTTNFTHKSKSGSHSTRKSMSGTSLENAKRRRRRRCRVLDFVKKHKKISAFKRCAFLTYFDL